MDVQDAARLLRLDWQQYVEGAARQQLFIVAGAFDPDAAAMNIDDAACDG